MLKRVAHSLGLVEQTGTDPGRRNELKSAKKSPAFSIKSKNIFVKIVHPEGKRELYKHAIPASKLMEKYPGMCVALPEVFRDPHQSVLWPEEYLLPGQKYIMISCRDVEKLKRKYPEEGKTKELAQEVLEAKITKSPSGHNVKENDKIKVLNGLGHEIFDAKTTLSPSKIEENGKVKEANGGSEEILNAKKNQSLGGGIVEELFCSAKDFYVSKDKSNICSKRKGIKGKKPFVPPLPKAKSYRTLGWQPSLATVQELSP